SSLEVLMTDDKAMTYGDGKLYAVPGALSVLGVFYNKKILKDAGINELPTTVSEFADDLKTVKDSGVTPMSLSGLDTGGTQLWGALTSVLGSSQDYKNWIYGKAGSTIEAEGAKKAAQSIV